MKLRAEITQKAEEHKRYGYRRIYVLLRRDGWYVNHKRVYRIYREEELQVKKRKRKKTARSRQMPLVEPDHINKRWSMDFMEDSVEPGRKLRILNIIDDCSRELLWSEVATSISGHRVVRILKHLKEYRGLPEQIVTDNGPEFSSNAVDKWIYQQEGTEIRFIEPGKPNQNAYIESFNDKMRDECLNEHWFFSVAEARQIIESWRETYNTYRPHSSLDNMTPSEYASSLPGLQSATPPSVLEEKKNKKCLTNVISGLT